MNCRSRHPQSVSVWVPQWGRLLIITRFEVRVNDTTDPDSGFDPNPWFQFEITGNYRVELGLQVADLEQTE